MTDFEWQILQALLAAESTEHYYRAKAARRRSVEFCVQIATILFSGGAVTMFQMMGAPASSNWFKAAIVLSAVASAVAAVIGPYLQIQWYSDTGVKWSEVAAELRALKLKRDLGGSESPLRSRLEAVSERTSELTTQRIDVVDETTFVKSQVVVSIRHGVELKRGTKWDKTITKEAGST